MKTKRNDKVAKTVVLLILVALFFSLGAGFTYATTGSSVIYNTIVKYDALKVLADALHYEMVVAEEVTVVAEVKNEEVITTVSHEVKEEEKAEEPKEEKEEVVEETVEETVTTVSYNTTTNNTTTNNTTTNNNTTTTNNNNDAAKKAAEEAARKAAEEAAAKKAAEEAARQAAAEEAARQAAAAEAARQATASVQEWSIGLPGGTMKYYTGISYDQLCNNLQGLIDSGYIVKYSNYFAGHNPGAMGHLAGIGIGSTVRLSYGAGEYYDYTIVSHTTGSGSFADINFPGYGNLWYNCMGNGNYIVIQFCINGVNNFFLGTL